MLESRSQGLLVMLVFSGAYPYSKKILHVKLLNSDSLSNFMRQQAMSSRMVFNRPVPVNRLVTAIADSTQFSSTHLSS